MKLQSVEGRATRGWGNGSSQAVLLLVGRALTRRPCEGEPDCSHHHDLPDTSGTASEHGAAAHICRAAAMPDLLCSPPSLQGGLTATRSPTTLRGRLICACSNPAPGAQPVATSLHKPCNPVRPEASQNLPGQELHHPPTVEFHQDERGTGLPQPSLQERGLQRLLRSMGAGNKTQRQDLPSRRGHFTRAGSTVPPPAGRTGRQCWLEASTSQEVTKGRPPHSQTPHLSCTAGYRQGFSLLGVELRKASSQHLQSFPSSYSGIPHRSASSSPAPHRGQP